MNAVLNLPSTAHVPPHSLAAEQAVLGGLMISDAALCRVLGLLAENDFYRKDHRLIFRAICDLDSKSQPYDAVTLGEWFESNGLAELVGGTCYVVKLANNTPSAVNIVAYANIVREKAILRKAIDIAAQLSADAFDSAGRGAQEILDETIMRLMAIQRTDAMVEYTAMQAAKKAFEAMVAAHAAGGALCAIPTGLIDLDEKLGGLHPGDLIIIGARAAMGKTSMLTGLALHAAKKGHAVGVVSGEQPAEQIAARMMAQEGRVQAKHFRTGQFEEHEWPRVTDACAALASARMWFLDRSTPTLAEVSSIARKWKQNNRIEVLYIDYLQRIQGEGERRWEQVGAVAKGLKNLARDLSIPVVALAQVSRQVEAGGKGRAPRLSDLSDSSEIEKEADQIFMLYREGYYDHNADQSLAQIIVEKNRHGPTGTVDVTWIPHTMTFANHQSVGATV